MDGSMPGDGIVACRTGFLAGSQVRSVMRVADAEWHLDTEPHPRDGERVHVCSVATAVGIQPSLLKHMAIAVGEESWCSS